MGHEIDINAINQSMGEQIRTAKESGGSNPRVLKKYSQQLIEYARGHKTLHSAQNKLKAIETKMAAIEQTYQQQEVPGAERHDKQYERLSDQKIRLTDNNFYRFGDTNKTLLSTDWDILQSLGNPLLTAGGDDSQHLADWPTSD